MKTWKKFVRPNTFVDGDYYMRKLIPVAGGTAQFILVQFAGYDPCPAWVIVRNQNGRRERVPREEIFKEIPVVYEDWGMSLAKVGKSLV